MDSASWLPHHAVAKCLALSCSMLSCGRSCEESGVLCFRIRADGTAAGLDLITVGWIDADWGSQSCRFSGPLTPRRDLGLGTSGTRERTAQRSRERGAIIAGKWCQSPRTPCARPGSMPMKGVSNRKIRGGRTNSRAGRKHAT